MWAVGISFLMMGSVPYWVKRLNAKQHLVEIPPYKNMFRCGMWILILWTICLFVPEPYNIILPVLPVVILGLWMLRFISQIMNRNGVDER